MKLLILGAGGAGREAADIAESMAGSPFEEIAFIDDGKPAGTEVNGYPVVGDRAHLRKLSSLEYCVCVAVGQPKLRYQLAASVLSMGFRLQSLISPDALISRHASIGEGCVVYPRVTIACNAVVGDNVLLNVGALVSHDVVVGRHAVISPRAQLLGAVKVGEGAELGTCACVYPGVSIGEWSKVAVNSVVQRDASPNVTLFNNSFARVFETKEAGWHDK